METLENLHSDIVHVKKKLTCFRLSPNETKRAARTASGTTVTVAEFACVVSIKECGSACMKRTQSRYRVTEQYHQHESALFLSGGRDRHVHFIGLDARENMHCESAQHVTYKSTSSECWVTCRAHSVSRIFVTYYALERIHTISGL